MQKILVTGGTGYIGSHTCVSLIKNGFEPVIVDNLSNSHPVVLDRIARIATRRPAFYQVDVRDRDALKQVFREHRISAAIHFAGLKAVGESILQPPRYYENNVEGALRLCEVAQTAGVRQLIFSSSAAVYGPPESLPILETASIRPTNPYGHTKATVEQILRDIHQANPLFRVGILRYFNAVGAHESGLIGEDPKGVPNNLLPFISQVATGQRKVLQVFGNDYPTPDGTGIRDYVHVMDLAEGHVAALNYLFSNDGIFTVNLGTGQGYSVLEIVKAFEIASNRRIPHLIVARRAGDTAASYADVDKALKLLSWRARRDLETMCADTWRWQCLNPDGYEL